LPPYGTFTDCGLFTFPLSQSGAASSASGEFAATILYAVCLMFWRAGGSFHENESSFREYPTGLVKNSPTVVSNGLFSALSAPKENAAAKTNNAPNNIFFIITIFSLILTASTKKIPFPHGKRRIVLKIYLIASQYDSTKK